MFHLSAFIILFSPSVIYTVLYSSIRRTCSSIENFSRFCFLDAHISGISTASSCGGIGLIKSTFAEQFKIGFEDRKAPTFSTFIRAYPFPCHYLLFPLFPLILSNNALIASYTRNVITDVNTKVRISVIFFSLTNFVNYVRM